MDFKKDVLQKSDETPVVVDFWAPWCGPCKYLTPVLEESEGESDGKWTLVKINVDEHPEISQSYGIRSIPNVKMFHKGKVIGEFAGALPRPAFDKWLQAHLPDPCEDLYDDLFARLSPDPGGDNVELLQEFLNRCPGFKPAKLQLARNLIVEDVQAARDLAGEFKLGDREYDEAQDVVQLAEMINRSFDEDSPVAKSLRSAREALVDGRFSDVAEALIQAAQQDQSFEKELPRRLGIAFFRFLGPTHPVSREHRRLFDMVLT